MRPFLALSMLALMAGACAPTTQLAAPLDAASAGPRLEPDRFVSFDGARLGLSSWTPTEEPWAVIVAVHGINDYAGGFQLAGRAWAERGIATYAYDGRGFGRSPRRGVWADPEVSAEDLRTFVALVRRRHPHATLAVLGESMGAAVSLHAFGSDRPPDADRLIVTAPAVWGWRTQPLLYRTTLWLAAHVAGPYPLTPPRWVTRTRRATDNVEELRRMGGDPHMLFRTRIDAIYGLVALMQRGSDGLPRVRTPLLMLYGDRDDMVPPEPVFAAAARAPAGARTAYYAGGHHLLLRDLERERALSDIAAFIRTPTIQLPSGAPAIPTVPLRQGREKTSHNLHLPRACDPSRAGVRRPALHGRRTRAAHDFVRFHRVRSP